MKILVTGSTGFIGHNLVPNLIDNHVVYLVTTNPEKAKKLFGQKVHIFSYVQNQQKLVDFVSTTKPEVIIHLASHITSSDEFNDAEKLIDVNIKFLISILDALKEYPPKLFINTGTFAEYLNNDDVLDPAYLYAATKTASRFIIKYYSKAYKFKHINMVLYSVYGKNDSQKKIIDYLFESAEKPIDFTLGEQVLDFIHVDDVVRAYINVIKNIEVIENGDTMYVGTGKGTSIRKLAGIIEVLMNKKLQINWGSKEYRKRDVMYAVAPLEKNKLNFQKSLTLDAGLAIYLGEK